MKIDYSEHPDKKVKNAYWEGYREARQENVASDRKAYSAGWRSGLVCGAILALLAVGSLRD